MLCLAFTWSAHAHRTRPLQCCLHERESQNHKFTEFVHRIHFSPNKRTQTDRFCYANSMNDECAHLEIQKNEQKPTMRTESFLADSWTQLFVSFFFSSIYLMRPKFDNGLGKHGFADINHPNWRHVEFQDSLTFLCQSAKFGRLNWDAIGVNGFQASLLYLIKYTKHHLTRAPGIYAL